MCSEKVVAKMKKVVFWVAKVNALAGDALRSPTSLNTQQIIGTYIFLGTEISFKPV